MLLGVPREIKDGETRVGLTPDGAARLVQAGHTVRVGRKAGQGAGFPDEAYRAAGVDLVDDPGAIYACPLIVKVKELQPAEYALLQRGTTVLAYQQLARDPHLLDAVLGAGLTCLAYEGVTDGAGGRPLLAPMSRLAGCLSAQVAAWALQGRPGEACGSGALLWALEGVPQARVLIVGEGIAGSAAAEAFHRMGCAVTVVGLDCMRMEALREQLGAPWIDLAPSETGTLEVLLPGVDAVVGAVATPGRLSPKLLTRAMLRSMRPGSVFVDIGIDMGGISETSRQTKLLDPLYVEEGVVHYGVPNMPALVPRAATQALCVATLPVIERIAGLGLAAALRDDPGLRQGLLVHDGRIVHPGLAADTGRRSNPFPF